MAVALFSSCVGAALERYVWLSHRPTLPPNNVSAIVNSTTSCQKWRWLEGEAVATAVAMAEIGAAVEMEACWLKYGVLNALMNCLCSIIMVGWSSRVGYASASSDESSGNEGWLDEGI